MIKQITETEFESEVLKTIKPVIVYVWTSWSQPCLIIEPTIKSLAKKNLTIKFVGVDADKCHIIISNYNIKAVPTIMVFKDGTLRDSIIGIHKGIIIKVVNKLR